jgi:hypothetical protein
MSNKRGAMTLVKVPILMKDTKEAKTEVMLMMLGMVQYLD